MNSTITKDSVCLFIRKAACPVCDRAFIDVKLGCGHSVCYQCLEHDGSLVACPVCEYRCSQDNIEPDYALKRELFEKVLALCEEPNSDSDSKAKNSASSEKAHSKPKSTKDSSHCKPQTAKTLPTDNVTNDNSNLSETTLIMKNIPDTVQEGDILEIFSAVNVKEVYGLAQGHAFLTFPSAQCKQKAQDLFTDMQLEGSTITLTPATEIQASLACINASSAMVLVENLPSSVTNERLMELFQAYNIKKACVVTDCFSQSKGYAFLEFNSPKALATVLQVPFYEDGCLLKLKPCGSSIEQHQLEDFSVPTEQTVAHLEYTVIPYSAKWSEWQEVDAITDLDFTRPLRGTKKKARKGAPRNKKNLLPEPTKPPQPADSWDMYS